MTIPNVFSPNSDGLNDTWHVTYEAIDVFNCQIFNRWGKKIYEYDNVDGNWDGGDYKEGTYYYVITATGNDDKEYNESGTITLLRK